MILPFHFKLSWYLTRFYWRFDVHYGEFYFRNYKLSLNDGAKCYKHYLYFCKTFSFVSKKIYSVLKFRSFKIETTRKCNLVSKGLDIVYSSHKSYNDIFNTFGEKWCWKMALPHAISRWHWPKIANLVRFQRLRRVTLVSINKLLWNGA